MTKTLSDVQYLILTLSYYLISFSQIKLRNLQVIGNICQNYHTNMVFGPYESLSNLLYQFCQRKNRLTTWNFFSQVIIFVNIFL